MDSTNRTLVGSCTFGSDLACRSDAFNGPLMGVVQTMQRVILFSGIFAFFLAPAVQATAQSPLKIFDRSLVLVLHRAEHSPHRKGLAVLGIGFTGSAEVLQGLGWLP